MGKTVIIGLTGPTGAGKSKTQAAFDARGCRYIDCDVLSRRAVEPGAAALNQLAEVFGQDILRSDGSLDRALLAQRAFPTPDGRQLLNSIVHPAVIAFIEEIIAECQLEGTPGAVIDAPLLFESELDRRCDAVIAVIAPEELRLERIMARDGISQEAARLRMAAQHSSEYYSRQADYTIVNDGTVDELLQKTHRILDDILGKGDLS